MLSGFTDVFVTPHLKVYPQRDRNLKSGAKSNEKMQFQKIYSLYTSVNNFTCQNAKLSSKKVCRFSITPFELCV